MYNLVHFLKFLISLFLLSRVAFAALDGFDTLTWQRLLSFDGREFQAQYEWFYLGGSKNNSLKNEWELSLLAIRENKLVGREKQPFACVFPARFSFIQKFYPEFGSVRCPDFEEWRDEIGAQEIYIVYASSYVTNPASMFGHTFLRLSRGGEDRVSALTDYTVGFLAATDPRDDKVTYMIKGLSGGYIGHFEIKPFYMNVGLYQNAEDRDLWQYKLSLTREKIDFLIEHLWELSLNTGFKYYFFDENCSTALLRLIEVSDEDINFLEDRNYIFAHPIETIKWAQEYLEVNKSHYYASSNKILRLRIKNMTKSERLSYVSLKSNPANIENEKSIHVLDALIDHWKFENYKKNTKLSESERETFNRILLQRSKIPAVSKNMTIVPKDEESPLLFHDPNSIQLGGEYNLKEEIWTGKLAFKLGYHGILDRHIGHDSYSFIDYFKFNFTLTDNRIKLSELNFVEILSLAPFLKELPTISWNVAIDYKEQDIFMTEDYFNFQTALGVSFLKGINLSYMMLGMQTHVYSLETNLRPYIQLANRLTFDKSMLYSSFRAFYFREMIKPIVDVGYTYYISKSSDLRILGEYKSALQESASLSLIWNFYY